MTTSRYQCNAETGKAPTWKVCKNYAHFRIYTSSGGYLYYCDRHAHNRKQPLHFRAAPFATMEKFSD
jgi:hypothetical protein